MHRFFVLPLLTLTACMNFTATGEAGPGDTDPVGRVAVAYAATSDGDVVTARDPATGIDAAGLRVARDGTFLLAPRAPGFSLLAADDATFVIDATGRARALSRGRVGVLVVAADGDVSDFVDLDVADVAAVTIAPDGALPSATGDSVLLAARASDSSATPLAGSLSWTWASSDASVVAISPTSSDPGARVRATALRPGKSTIAVRGAGVEATIAMEVTR